MSLSSKITSLQAYSMSLYRTALHPEFFKIEDRRCIERGEYEFEAWIFKGGHLARFENNGLCITEVVSDDNNQLPERGLVSMLPCAGEKDHEAEVSERLEFMTSIQTETLTDHLFLSTYNELQEHGRTSDALMTVWGDNPEKPNLSMVDLQRYGNQVHLQGYHLRNDCGLVLRTQSIFQIADS